MLFKVRGSYLTTFMDHMSCEMGRYKNLVLLLKFCSYLSFLLPIPVISIYNIIFWFYFLGWNCVWYTRWNRWQRTTIRTILQQGKLPPIHNQRLLKNVQYSNPITMAQTINLNLYYYHNLILLYIFNHTANQPKSIHFL